MYITTLLQRITLIVTAGIMLLTLKSQAQVVTIKGTVTDKHTTKVIPGASVRIGNYSTSTDVEGNYVILVQKTVAEQEGIVFRSVGFQSIKRVFLSNEVSVELVPTATELREVVIASPTESIVNRAIRKIPENYRFEEFIIKGNLRIVNSAKYDTATTYYYKSEAALKLYYPRHDKQFFPDIALIHKQDTLIVDPKKRPEVRWLGGYTTVSHKDYVRLKPEFLSTGSKKYNYVVNGKDWINKHRVYIVNFFSSQQTGSAGTLYIDTASYAFVRIAYTSYHIKRAMMIDIDKSSNVIDYQQRGRKWYLKATETNILANRNKFDLFKSSSFKTEEIETEAVEPITYKDRLPDNMEDIGLGKTATSNLSALDTVLKQPFAPTTLPSIDTTPPVSTTLVGRLNLLEILRNYVLKDNIHVRYGLAILPVMINGNQSLLRQNASSINNYAFYTNTLFRLINSKALFLQYEHLFNLGIPRLKSSGDSYGMTYDFQLNRTGHPITFSPSFGISTLEIGKKKAVYYKQKSIYYGISFTYEISPRTGWFIAGKYDDIYNIKNTELHSKRQAISASAGFTFKLKT